MLSRLMQCNTEFSYLGYFSTRKENNKKKIDAS